jgi:hypothetical protein
LKGIVAKGSPGIDGFIVHKGSQAVLDERQSTKDFPYAHALRQRLIQEGILERREQWYEFLKDTEFTSPCAAAAVVHGGSANGLREWKTQDGRMLKEIQEP